jgi:DNA replication and repair protein RecF
MLLKFLKLTQFRCYAEVRIDVPDLGLRIVGDNATGKTSLLEAVGLLATTRSFRNAQDRDLVRWGSGEEYAVAPFARVEATIDGGEGQHQLGIAIELAKDAESVASKRFELDGRITSAHRMVGHFTTVTFTPEDVQLVIGAPADRRRSLDILISQIDRVYLQRLTRYSQVLRQRNSLLKSFARDRVLPTAAPAVTQISFWDEQLVAEGGYLVALRARMLDQLDRAMEQRSSEIAGEVRFGLRYASRTSVHLPSLTGETNDHDAVTRANQALHDDLERHRADEFRRGMTLTGPHRDDIEFEIAGRSLARFGSRGQQRMGVLALKLAEADVVAIMTGDGPVFLLDDVLSELDNSHRDLLLDAVRTHASQLLLTSADPDLGRHSALSDLGTFAT